MEPEPAVRAESTENASGTWWLLLAAVVAVAFLLRLFYLNQLAALPFFDQPVGDSAVYLDRAREIASGAILPARPFFYGSVLYPYFLAAVLACSHGHLYWVGFSQIVAGAVLVALLATLTRRMYGPQAGLAAGILIALYGPFAFLEADVLGVVWGSLALVLGLLACVNWAPRPARARQGSVAWLLAAGVAFGLAAVERPNLSILIPLAAAWCVAQARHGRARSALALFAGAALPLLLVVVLNVAGTGQWVPLTTSGGINLSIGYHRGATGTYEEPWEQQASEFAAQHTDLEEASVAMASREVGRAVTPQEASAHWAGKAMSYIQGNPAAAALLTIRKAALMLNDAEVPNHLDYTFIRNQATALWLMPLGFGVVLALAVLGIVFSLATGWRRPGTLLLALVAGGTLLSVLPFFVADRYRGPMVLPLLAAAGAGVAVLLRLLRDPSARSDRRNVMALAGALVAVLIAMMPLSRPLMGRDYWMLAQAYQARGNLPAAVAAYEAAAHEEGNDAALLNNLASVYRAAGQREKAVATLQRAIAVDPRLVLPHKNLGMALYTLGDTNGALLELREAARLDPNDAQTLGAIGALLAERGENGPAAEAFAAAQRLAPNDQRLAALLRQYPAVAGLLDAAHRAR